MTSDYFKALSTEAKDRYRQKLMFRGRELPDPLDDDVVRFSFSPGSKHLPSVTTPEQQAEHLSEDMQ